MTRCTLHIEVDDPGDLAAIVEAVEGLGHRVECPAFAGRLRRQQRDHLLRQCHELMSGASSWARCLLLAQEIERFERRWPALRDRETPPERCSALRSYLFEARRLGGPLPSSARQLHTIVSSQGRDTLKRDDAGHFSGEHD